MEHFFRKIRLTEAYKCTCGACKKRVDAEEQLKLLEAPNILILQIKRFDFNGRKNTKIIEFNLDLDLAPYMAQNIGASQDTRYTLSGVLSAPHSDIQSIDHHSACVRSLDGDWRVMARKEVIKVTKEQLKQREAYFLFYVQDGAKPPPRSPRPAEPILSGDCMPLSQRRPSMRAMAQQATTVLSPPLWGGAASISPLLQQSPAAATPPSPLEHLVMAAVPPPSPLQQSPAAATPPSPLEHPVMAAVPPPSPLQQSPAAATPPSPLEHPVMAAVPPPSPLQQSPAAATPPSPLEHPVMAAVPPPSPLQQIMAEMSSLPQRSVVLEKSIEVQLSFHPGHEEADGDSTSTAGSCSTRPHVRRLRPIGEIRVDIRRVLKEVREQRAKGMAGAVASTTSAAAGCDSGCGDLVHPAADATASHKRKFEESDSGNGATGVLGRLVKISRLERVTTKWALPPRGADYRTCKNGDIV
ncbi:hypothetical protein Vafri_19014 [Volvox africanus]|nr:hypothetical protein Vafri_19014 [Volvox africanus]